MDASGPSESSFVTPDHEGMGERQKKPANGTPATDAESPQASSSRAHVGPPQQPYQPRGQAKDLIKVEEAVSKLDGFSSTKRPDEASTSTGRGQELKFLKTTYEEDDLEEDDIVPIRPAEQTLRRISRPMSPYPWTSSATQTCRILSPSKGLNSS